MSRSLAVVNSAIERSRLLTSVVDVASRLLPKGDASAYLCGQSYWWCGDACWNCNCPNCGPCWGRNCGNHVYAVSYDNCLNGHYYSYTCFDCC